MLFWASVTTAAAFAFVMSCGGKGGAARSGQGSIASASRVGFVETVVGPRSGPMAVFIGLRSSFAQSSINQGLYLTGAFTFGAQRYEIAEAVIDGSVSFTATDAMGNSLSCSATVVGADLKNGSCEGSTYRFQALEATANATQEIFCDLGVSTAATYEATQIGEAVILARASEPAGPVVVVGMVRAGGAVTFADQPNWTAQLDENKVALTGTDELGSWGTSNDACHTGGTGGASGTGAVSGTGGTAGTGGGGGRGGSAGGG